MNKSEGNSHLLATSEGSSQEIISVSSSQLTTSNGNNKFKTPLMSRKYHNVAKFIIVT